MQPLSLKKRTLILGLLTMIGMTMVPFLLLYANGYRMSKENVVVETGGIFVHPFFTHGTLAVDNIPVSDLSLFNHDDFVQSLLPNVYLLRYSRPGYTTWQKSIRVENQHVTDVNPFILPLDIPSNDIPKTITEDGGVTPNPEYLNVANLFKTKVSMANTVLPLADGFFSVPIPFILDHTIALALDETDLKAYWTGNFDSIPQIFCESANHCATSITVYDDAEHIAQYMYYPGGKNLVLLSLSDGIYIREIDPRGEQNMAKIYAGTAPLMRLSEGNTLYIKDTGAYKKIMLP